MPPVGILGFCLNLITIVSHDTEDPIEPILKTLSEAGVESFCFPGIYERQTERQTERDSFLNGVAVHRFQLRLPNPSINQMKALDLIKQLQL